MARTLQQLIDESRGLTREELEAFVRNMSPEEIEEVLQAVQAFCDATLPVFEGIVQAIRATASQFATALAPVLHDINIAISAWHESLPEECRARWGRGDESIS